MRLAWAKTKKIKDLPSEIRCCKKSDEVSRESECKILIVDLDDIRSCQLTSCFFCGATGEVRKGFRVVGEEAQPFGEYVFVDVVDIAEGEFDPNCKPTE
jgi:hypothetical protein